jgi:phage replication O-like protein O
VDSIEHERFVRLPTALLEAILACKLTGVQTRILLWVIRQTYGWNRRTTLFSWYQVAKDLSLDRGGVVRSGRTLMQANVLCAKDGRLGFAEDFEQWRVYGVKRDDGTQLRMTRISDDRPHRQAKTPGIGTDATDPRERCPQSSSIRRAKDSRKDRSKTYKDMNLHKVNDARQPLRTPNNTQRRLVAGAAVPIPGKYDRLSQD